MCAVWMYMCESQCLRRLKEGITSLDTDIKDCCELSDMDRTWVLLLSYSNS